MPTANEYPPSLENSESQPTTPSGSLRSTDEAELDSSRPVYPSLVHCNLSIDLILPRLTSSVWWALGFIPLLLTCPMNHTLNALWLTGLVDWVSFSDRRISWPSAIWVLWQKWKSTICPSGPRRCLLYAKSWRPMQKKKDWLHLLVVSLIYELIFVNLGLFKNLCEFEGWNYFISDLENVEIESKTSELRAVEDELANLSQENCECCGLRCRVDIHVLSDS